MANCAVTADISNTRVHTSEPATAQTRTSGLTNTKSRYVMTFPAPTTRIHGCFVIPPNYLTGDIIIRARYVVPVATTGQASFTCEIVKFTDGISTTSPTAISSSATVDAAVVGAGNVGELVFTLTSSSPTVGVVNFYGLRFSRTTGTNTLGTNDVDFLDYDVEYQFDPTIQKQYTWLPANIWLPLAGSPSSLGAPLQALGIASTARPYAHTITDTAGNAIGTHIQLPSTYNGGLTSYTIWQMGSATSAHNFGLAMGAAAVGDAYDATLTTDTFTVTPGGASSQIKISQRTAPISPNAGEMLSLKWTRDESDASGNSISFFGVLLEYNVFAASPSPVQGLSPECWSAPTSGAASLLAIADANNSGFVQRFTQGVTQSCNTKRLMPGIYQSGGTFRGYLRTTASSGTIIMRIDYGNPAVLAGADPTMNTGSNVNVPVTAAGDLLMFTADISPGVVSGDEIFLTMNRIGASDGVTADVDYVEGHVEVGVGA